MAWHEFDNAKVEATAEIVFTLDHRQTAGEHECGKVRSIAFECTIESVFNFLMLIERAVRDERSERRRVGSCRQRRAGPSRRRTCEAERQQDCSREASHRGQRGFVSARTRCFTNRTEVP